MRETGQVGRRPNDILPAHHEPCLLVIHVRMQTNFCWDTDDPQAEPHDPRSLSARMPMIAYAHVASTSARAFVLKVHSESCQSFLFGVKPAIHKKCWQPRPRPPNDAYIYGARIVRVE
jgi:hypothetical protein